MVMARAADDNSIRAAAQRAVLLGASNLSRCMPAVLEAAQLARGGPLEMFFACGHGRSYGLASKFFGRTLPGIVQSEIWAALAERPAAPTTALVTDIGNDLLYGASPAQIAAWVAECIDRLLQLETRPVVTALPLMNLASLSAARFRFFRTLFFPPCRLGLEQICAAARELDERVREIAAARGATVVEPRGAWYGLDPIHIRYRHAPAAWNEVLAAWSETRAARGKRLSLTTSLRMHRLKPAQRWVGGREQRAAQPVERRADGTTLWLY
jgi:hypothetical protein